MAAVDVVKAYVLNCASAEALRNLEAVTEEQFFNGLEKLDNNLEEAYYNLLMMSFDLPRANPPPAPCIARSGMPLPTSAYSIGP